MFLCPYCDHPLSASALSCPECAGEVRALALVHELPTVQFNHAVRAARGGDWASATLLLNAVLAVYPNDVEAWVLLGTIQARRGLFALACEYWRMALALRRDEPRALQGLKTVEKLLAEAKTQAGA